MTNVAGYNSLFGYINNISDLQNQINTIPPLPLVNKGDLITKTSTTPTNLPVSPTDTHVLMVDSSTETGLNYMQVDHLNLANIGTNTHANIDTHIGASSGVHGVVGSVVGTTDSQTLTNKTLTAPVISTIVNTGTLTLPTSTDTLVGRATTDTLTNKTLTSPVISTIVNTGTLSLPTSTDTLVGRATTDTLTDKTIDYYTSNSLKYNGTSVNQSLATTASPSFAGLSLTDLSSTTSSAVLALGTGNVIGTNSSIVTTSGSQTLSGKTFDYYTANTLAYNGTKINQSLSTSDSPIFNSLQLNNNLTAEGSTHTFGGTGVDNPSLNIYANGSTNPSVIAMSTGTASYFNNVLVGDLNIRAATTSNNINIGNNGSENAAIQIGTIGCTFNNSGITGASPTTLSYYEAKGAQSYTYTGPFASPVAVDISLTRIGNVVTLSQTGPGAGVVSGTATSSAYIELSTDLPARFIPSYDFIQPIVVENSGSPTTGVININTSGNVIFSVGVNTTQFTGSGTCGIYNFSASYNLS